MDSPYRQPWATRPVLSRWQRALVWLSPGGVLCDHRWWREYTGGTWVYYKKSDGRGFWYSGIRETEYLHGPWEPDAIERWPEWDGHGRG